MTQKFDPNGPAEINSGIFGLPYSPAEAKLVILPVPWEATTSYGGGTSEGPRAILAASRQVDLYDLELGNFYEIGIAMLKESAQIRQYNREAKKRARAIIKLGGNTAKNKKLGDALKEVNAYSEKVNDYVYRESKKLLAQEKIVAVLGGDHSCPFGAIRAYLEKYPDMGVLHIDAHADLREAYEGFTHSHASIFHNVITRTPLKKLIQVGIRDFGEAEFDFIQAHPSRIRVFFDQHLNDWRMQGQSWATICNDIIKGLPQEVYLSFDIDGLDPRLCPSTGTPVPGGLSFQEATYLIRKVAQSGRKIIGFDLNEVAPGPKGDEWDANVGARLLYKMCGWTLSSQQRAETAKPPRTSIDKH